MANSFEHISIGAVKVLAQLAARKAVKSELARQGLLVAYVPARDLHIEADQYLDAHPELISEAREQAQRLGMYERRRSYRNS
jgi:hypothetical protein